MTTDGATRSNSGICGSKQVVTVLLQGTFFYLTVASGPVFMKVSGTWTLYYSGTGTEVTSGFKELQVYNPTGNAVTFQIVAGYSPFIDKRAILSTATPSIIKPVNWAVQSSPQAILLPDVSGQIFNDINGTPWLAIQRILLFAAVLNQGNDVTMQLGTGSNPAAAGSVIYNQGFLAANAPWPDPLVIQAAGNFWIQANPPYLTGQLCVSAYEVYQAVAPNSQAYQPPN